MADAHGIANAAYEEDQLDSIQKKITIHLFEDTNLLENGIANSFNGESKTNDMRQARRTKTNEKVCGNNDFVTQISLDCDCSIILSVVPDEHSTNQTQAMAANDINSKKEHKIKNRIVELVSKEENGVVKNVEGKEREIRPKIAAFLSFREKKAKKQWRRNSLDEELKFFSKLKESTPTLNRSQYSLVSASNQELTPGAVKLWMDLPEEVKYDPALAQFRLAYEKEHGSARRGSNTTINSKVRRLPFVNSAPHLNNNINNLHSVSEHVIFLNGMDRNMDVRSVVVEEKGEPEYVEEEPKVKESKIARAKYLTKMTLLIACWLYFTVVFLMYTEKEDFTLNTFVGPGESKEYNLSTANELRLRLEVLGPFLSEGREAHLNVTQVKDAPKLEFWLQSTHGLVSNGTRLGLQLLESNHWQVILDEIPEIDFNVGEFRSTVLSSVADVVSNFSLMIRNTGSKTVPFRFSYMLNPLHMVSGVIYAAILLCGLYVLIIFEIINRAMAALLMSTAGVATLALVGERPTLMEIVSWLDMETLLLLFSMMVLVAIMAETGMFDYLSVLSFEVTKGKLWPLITLLCAITAILSTFLDNVTTVLLMTPVTIRLCEVMELNPVPILMSMVIFSNIGGTATPVGDPPNVIIASNKQVQLAGVNFTNFTLHMLFGVLLVCVQTYIQLRFIFRDTNRLRLGVPKNIQETQRLISIWRRAADSVPRLSSDELMVHQRLEKKIKKLQHQLEIDLKESIKRACPKATFKATLEELKGKYKIRDKVLLVKSSIAIGFCVALFFLHSIPALNKVSLGWVALLGAILLLLLADREDLEPILHRVEWSTLLFFAALFVLMEALAKLGLIKFIGGITEDLIMRVDDQARLAVAILIILWVSGLSSAFVDNIPLTTMMIRVVCTLGAHPTMNIPLTPLIWALSFGACLGGNGTLIGASANVVCAGVAEQHGYKITFGEFFKLGFPIMLGHLVVASLYLLACHCLLEWH